MHQDLYEAVAAAINEPDPGQKVALATELAATRGSNRARLRADGPPGPIGLPGRPRRPHLVSPRELPRRRLTSPAGRAALIHAVAHIELNAIDLALDAAYRFRDLPRSYTIDWLGVAAEEARHFSLLRERLQQLDHDYGDFPAHGGLWEMARQTAHDPLARMAMVPRVLEARGLDVTPGMIERLRAVGDGETCAVLEVILREEVGHVSIGNRWYHHLCEQRGLEPRAAFRRLLATHLKGGLKTPLNRAARIAAGFDPNELDELEALA